MFSESPSRKAEKIIKKALKIVNKQIRNDKYMLGRYEVRDCFHQISQTKEKGLLVSYCFEYVDKATKAKKFYAFGTETLMNKITVERFIKNFQEMLNAFIETVPAHPKDNHGKRIDYRKVKID